MEGIKRLAAFYGQEVEIEFQGKISKFDPVLDGNALLFEWPVFVFKRVLLYENEAWLSNS